MINLFIHSPLSSPNIMYSVISSPQNQTQTYIKITLWLQNNTINCNYNFITVTHTHHVYVYNTVCGFDDIVLLYILNRESTFLRIHHHNTCGEHMKWDLLRVQMPQLCRWLWCTHIFFIYCGIGLRTICEVFNCALYGLFHSAIFNAFPAVNQSHNIERGSFGFCMYKKSEI